MKKTYGNAKKNKGTGAIISIFCLLIIILFSEITVSGIKKGLGICTDILIPSLFPMITVSSFFISCGFSERLRNILHGILNLLFGISGNAAEAIFAGLTGGYNIASRSAVKLLKEGKLSIEEAKRTAMFFTSPGLSFCINIAGECVYNSRFVGIRFYISSILASILCATVYQRLKKNRGEYKAFPKSTSLSSALSDSVEHSSYILFNICAWVILFYGISPLAEKLCGNLFFFPAIKLFGEVTSGLSFSAQSFPLSVSSFVLSFGGICIFLQQLPDTVQLRTPPLVFITARSCVSLASAVIFYLSQLIFPLSAQVFSQQPKVLAFSHSPVGSFALMILCAVFLFSIKNTHTQVTNQHNSR